MKTINIKKMAKDMTFRDKVKLLFADRNLRGDSEGKDRVLSPDEEEAIIKDCREKRQIDELNRLNQLHNLSIFALIDVQSNTLRLQHALTRIHFFSMCMYLKGKLSDTSISERACKSIGPMYDVFYPSDDEPENSSHEEKLPFYATREPNHYLQSFYVSAVECTKDLKKALHTIEYLDKLADMDLVHEQGKLQIAKAKSSIHEFEDAEAIFKGFIELYKNFMKLELMRQDTFEQPLFLKLLTTSQNLTSLSDAEKLEVEKMVDKYCARDLF